MIWLSPIALFLMVGSRRVAAGTTGAPLNWPPMMKNDSETVLINRNNRAQANNNKLLSENLIYDYGGNEYDLALGGGGRLARSSGEVTATVTSYRDITFAVLLPRTLPLISHSDIPSLVLSAMELGVRNLKRAGHLVGYNVTYEFADTKCSSTYGPMAAFDMVVKRKPNAFFGLMCKYVLAPVARYSGVWGIPVLTAGGISDSFSLKDQYPTLTRLVGGHLHIGPALKEILGHFNWTTAAILNHNHDDKVTKGNSDCSMAMASVYRTLNSSESIYQEFDENTANHAKLLSILDFTKRNARSKCLFPVLYRF